MIYKNDPTKTNFTQKQIDVIKEAMQEFLTDERGCEGQCGNFSVDVFWDEYVQSQGIEFSDEQREVVNNIYNL